MALIQCPNCGKPISDKANSCIHCGFEISPEKERHCIECGAVLTNEVTVCPHCGCPVDSQPDSSQAPQQVEVTGVKVSQKSKKVFAIVIAAICVILSGVFIAQQIQKQNAEKEAIRISQEYFSNLKLAATTILSGAADAEDCGNLIKQVWYNAIYEEIDPETDPYTRPHGYFFVSDFNVALNNLFSDSDFAEKIDDIKRNQVSVQLRMRDLKNPPDDYKDAYEALSDFYDAYINLTNLAVNPTGSLQTFSSNFNDADTETSNCYSALQLYLN